MTLEDIKRLLITADPEIRHHFSTEREHDYSYWEETQRLPMMADDGHEEAWRFYVHRFTRDEFDPVAKRIFRAMDGDPRIAVQQTITFDQESGYIHHIFKCEGC